MDRIFPGQDQLRKQARTTQQDCESRAFAVVQSPLAIGDCHGPSLREPGAAPAAPNRYGLPCRSGGAGQSSGYLPQPMSTHGVVTCPPLTAPLPERDSVSVKTKGGHSMPRGKKELAEQIIPYATSVEVEVGRGKTVAESVKKIGVTEQTYS